MEWVCYIVLFALLCLGFLLTLLMMRGNWLMILATVLYAGITRWRIIGWRTAAMLLAIGIAGEIVDVITGSGRPRVIETEPPWSRFVGMLVKIAFAGTVFLVGTFLGFPGKRHGM